MKKRILLILLLLVLFIRPSQSLADKVRVYDYANLLEKAEIEKLEARAARYSKRRETDFIILTTNDPQGKDVVDYMEDFYDDRGLGYNQAHGNTAIITIDMMNREVYLAGFYKAESYLDDYRLDLIRDKITSDLSRGDYYRAFNKFLKLGHKYMGMEPHVDPNNILFSLGFQLIVSFGIAGVLVGGMAYSSGGRRTVNQRTYMNFANSRVINRRDRFIRTAVSKTRKPPKNKSSGGDFGGGSSGGGRTSGGHSHSGSRGRF